VKRPDRYRRVRRALRTARRDAKAARVTGAAYGAYLALRVVEARRRMTRAAGKSTK